MAFILHDDDDDENPTQPTHLPLGDCPLLLRHPCGQGAGGLLRCLGAQGRAGGEAVRGGGRRRQPQDPAPAGGYVPQLSTPYPPPPPTHPPTYLPNRVRERGGLARLRHQQRQPDCPQAAVGGGRGGAGLPPQCQGLEAGGSFIYPPTHPPTYFPTHLSLCSFIHPPTHLPTYP